MSTLHTDLIAKVFGTAHLFVPEQTDLGSYEFVPLLRNGLSAAIDGATEENRAVVSASFDLVGEPPEATPPLPGAAITISRALPLRGPGDVIGIDQAQIVRRFPTPSTQLDDDSSLAVIEFDRPDLPWLHSPKEVIGGTRLTPWIALVVCDTRRASIRPGQGGLPPVLRTARSELQSLDGGWAWAHAQIMGSIAGGPDVATRLGEGMAAQNLSRLVCPKRLDEHSHYYACVVPTFDCGVKAGLGRPEAGTLEDAWVPGDGDTVIELPVYATWSFTIGTGYDFEKLARRLIPVPAPWQIGRRTVDMRTPRGGLPDDLTGQGAVQLLDGALYSPQDPPSSAATAVDWAASRTESLRREVAPDVVDQLLPRVGARLYGRFQRGRNTLPKVTQPVTVTSDWFGALNLRPADRLVAGLGTRVVQRDQDKLMQAAWTQVGEVRAANAELDRIRLARYVSEALMKKTLGRMKLGPLTAITRPVHGKIPIPNNPRTIWGEIQASSLPQVAAGVAFRRTLAGGPVARAALKGVAMARRRQLGEIVGPAASIRDMRRLYAEPLGVTGVLPALVETFQLDRLAAILKVPMADAKVEALRRVGGVRPLAARLAVPRDQWRLLPEGRGGVVFDLAVARFDELSKALSHPMAETVAGRDVLGGRLVALAERNPELSARVDARLARLGQAMGSRQTPRGAASDTVRTRFQSFADVGRKQRGGVAAPTREITNARLADGLMKLAPGIRDMRKTPPLAAPMIDRNMLLTALEPGRNARGYLLGRLGRLPGFLPGDWFDDLQVKPIMAAPRFDRPMYEALQDYDPEWLIPNLGLIDKPDFVTLLFDNPRFIEAFLIGLSDEMGRELLWRDYPTDQRGTYFHRFWRDDVDEIGEIARFNTAKPLGAHVIGGDQPRVVMLLRGQVIKRHPEAMFVAVHGKKDDAGKMEFSSPPGLGTGRILFHAPLAEDTILVGFDLTEADIIGGDWWFLLAEHPTAPRFGFDPTDDHKPATGVNSLEWADMPMSGRFLTTNPGPTVLQDGVTLAWPSHAGVVARMLLQNPARAAFDAKKLMQGVK